VTRHPGHNSTAFETQVTASETLKARHPRHNGTASETQFALCITAISSTQSRPWAYRWQRANLSLIPFNQRSDAIHGIRDTSSTSLNGPLKGMTGASRPDPYKNAPAKAGEISPRGSCASPCHAPASPAHRTRPPTGPAGPQTADAVRPPQLTSLENMVGSSVRRRGDRLNRPFEALIRPQRGSGRGRDRRTPPAALIARCFRRNGPGQPGQGGSACSAASGDAICLGCSSSDRLPGVLELDGPTDRQAGRQRRQGFLGMHGLPLLRRHSSDTRISPTRPAGRSHA